MDKGRQIDHTQNVNARFIDNFGTSAKTSVNVSNPPGKFFIFNFKVEKAVSHLVGPLMKSQFPKRRRSLRTITTSRRSQIRTQDNNPRITSNIKITPT